jgi:hypothetical protein
MTNSLSVDKRQTLTHPDCGHPPEELLRFFKCCAIEITIKLRLKAQLDHAQLFFQVPNIANGNLIRKMF